MARPSRRSGCGLVLALLIGSCRIGPDYEQPDVSRYTNPAWREPSGPEVSAARTELAYWWQRFGSAELDALATRLVRENLSLGEARQRIVAARAQAGIVDAERLPQVSGRLNYERAGTGDKSLNFVGPPPGKTVNVYSAGVTGGWEIDFWGRVGRLVEAASAEIAIAIEDYRDAAVSLLAELALAYVDAVTLRQRIDVLHHNIDLQEQTVRIAQSRLDAGNGSRLDVEQSQRELELSRARVPELMRAARVAENRIAVLVGARPADNLVTAKETLTLPADVGTGLPAHLLARRADVRAAERRLAAEVARIGAAEAERYPRITISGTLAMSAMNTNNLTAGGDALSYSVGPVLSIPLFTGGRIDSQVRFQEARANVARLEFEQKLLGATEEVENAAEGTTRSRQRVAGMMVAVESARAAVTLARQLYERGVKDLLQVVDAQRAQLAIEEDLLVARQSAIAEMIHLYRALGGGWEPIELDGTTNPVTAGTEQQR